MSTLLAVIIQVFTPLNLLVTFVRAFVGIFVGAMPGLSSIMGLSLMLPLTLKLSGTPGILMLLGVFCGAIYGGSITAILIKTPGTALGWISAYRTRGGLSGAWRFHLCFNLWWPVQRSHAALDSTVTG